MQELYISPGHSKRQLKYENFTCDISIVCSLSSQLHQQTHDQADICSTTQKLD